MSFLRHSVGKSKSHGQPRFIVAQGCGGLHKGMNARRPHLSGPPPQFHQSSFCFWCSKSSSFSIIPLFFLITFSLIGSLLGCSPGQLLPGKSSGNIVLSLWPSLPPVSHSKSSYPARETTSPKPPRGLHCHNKSSFWTRLPGLDSQLSHLTMPFLCFLCKNEYYYTTSP